MGQRRDNYPIRDWDVFLKVSLFVQESTISFIRTVCVINNGSFKEQ